MIIVTTLYNAENYVDRCLTTLMTQTFKDFKCYITDDLSTDMSVEKVKSMIKGDSRFILIENTEKMYQPGNYDQVIRDNDDIDDNEIIIEVDGDDWLPDSKTLERINNVYSDQDIWIANGTFRYSNGQPGFASAQSNFNNLRNSRFTASHIRTWRAFLWRKIKQEDLKDENGVYWRVTGDLSFMFPMLEMAGEEHYKFMTDINYIYNEQNPLNDHKVDITLVNDIAVKIRNMSPYSKIDR
jgi:glycosyltransferase involved in cell wall biosynthesis|tara:strand:- start:56 stop:775 length:720 start_codon:yes stop_codon:yes gene_type:complete